MNTNYITTRDPEYDKAVWDAMRFRPFDDTVFRKGKTPYGTFKLPDFSESKFIEKLNKESLFRQVATVVYNKGDHDFWARDCGDTVSWIPEGESIPIYEGIDDFTPYQIGSHKIASIVRFQEEFVYSPGFDIEKHLTTHMAKTFARAEEYGFINGDGETQPIGILADEGGADIGVTASELTYEHVVKLFFSVKPEYRKAGKWLMNDETAQVLRIAKDATGNYIWNHNNDTILGKEVMISNEMPCAGSGTKPIAFGDFSYYWIFDREHFSVKALREKFASYGQVGYLGFEFLDGLLIRKDAVKVLSISGE